MSAVIAMDRAEEALLLAIRDDPGSDEPRLAYARWLVARGDRTGELIAVQCELARAAEDGPSYRELTEREGTLLRELAFVLKPSGYHYVPRRTRGFQRDEDLYVDAANFVDDADGWFRRAPAVSWLHLADAHPHVPRLATTPALARYRRLAFYSFNRPESPRPVLTDDDHQRLAESPHLTGLVALDVAHRDLQDGGLTAIAQARPLARLRHLEAGYNAGITSEGLRQLGGERCTLRELEYLDLSQTSQAVDGLLDALAGGSWQHLRELVLRECHFAERAADVVRALACLGAPLERLDLTSDDITDVDLEVLAHGATAGTLVELDLAFDPIGDRGLVALAAAPGLRCLRRLGLWRCCPGDDGVGALARGDGLPALTELELGWVPLGDAGVTALATSKRPFVTLGLQGCGLDLVRVERLLSAPWIATVRELVLADNRLGDGLARVLIDMDRPPALERLILYGNDLDDEARERIEERFAGVRLDFER